MSTNDWRQWWRALVIVGNVSLLSGRSRDHYSPYSSKKESIYLRDSHNTLTKTWLDVWNFRTAAAAPTMFRPKVLTTCKLQELHRNLPMIGSRSCSCPRLPRKPFDANSRLHVECRMVTSHAATVLQWRTDLVDGMQVKYSKSFLKEPGKAWSYWCHLTT